MIQTNLATWRGCNYLLARPDVVVWKEQDRWLSWTQDDATYRWIRSLVSSKSQNLAETAIECAESCKPNPCAPTEPFPALQTDQTRSLSLGFWWTTCGCDSDTELSSLLTQNWSPKKCQERNLAFSSDIPMLLDVEREWIGHCSYNWRRSVN